LGWESVPQPGYFLLLRQNKVTKEKATPGSPPHYVGSLPLLASLGRSAKLGHCVASNNAPRKAPILAAMLSGSHGDPNPPP